MKLLVSVIDLEEAEDVILSGCDILDIKNPKEGALGASHPVLIKKIIEYVNGKVEVSATIGDLPNLPGTASLAALGASILGVNCIKAGLYGVRKVDEAINLARSIVSAVKEFNPKVKVIACGYGDARYIGSIKPSLIPEVAYKSGADGVLIDLKSKGGKCLFDYLSREEVSYIVRKVHDYGLSIALAGGLSIKHVKILRELGVDIMGVRRSVCHSNTWLNSRISRSKVMELYRAIHEQIII